MWRSWFSLTPTERAFLAGICLIFLIGLTARYLHERAAAAPPAPSAVQPGSAGEAHRGL